MKLLPVLLLTFVLSLGVACSSEPPPVPDVPKYTEGEAIGLVQGMLRESREMVKGRTCSSYAKYLKNAKYLGEGKWKVTHGLSFTSHVYEGSNAVQTVRGLC